MTTPPAMTRNEVIDLLSYAQAIDGHQRGAPDVAVWLDAAHRGRWTCAAAIEALRTVGARFTGFRLMPGHVDEQVRADRRQPAPFAEAYPPLALEAAPPAADPTRAALVADFAAAQARKKAIGRPTPAELHAEHERNRAAMWAAIDGCARCDAGGMLPDDVLCDHRPDQRPADTTEQTAARG